MVPVDDCRSSSAGVHRAHRQLRRRRRLGRRRSLLRTPPRAMRMPAPRFTSALHDERTAAWLGIALGVTFAICFATGLWSHLQQNPPAWFDPIARPAGLYRATQGLHVATG